MKNLIYGLIFGVVLSGCASHGLGHHNAEQIVETDYAKVISTQPYTFDSQVEEAAIVGGVEGALFNIDEGADDVVAGAIAGALVSALFVKIEEGSNKGLMLEMQSVDNTRYSIVTKNTHIQANQCLRIVKGFEVSMKVVPEYFCDPYAATY